MDIVNPFEVIDGETLMEMKFIPLNFIVKGLIAQGLHILAGAPKTGKSWLCLWLCLCISKGEAIWGLETKKGTTLYLCLEDSHARIQNRLFDITEDAPNNLLFVTSSLSLSKGLEEQIEHFIALHPDTVLIIIDTLQMVRQVSSDYGYASDYKDLTILKKLSDKYQIAILLIHHMRKEEDKDTFNMISGTTGMQGAVDSCFTLVEEKRGERNAVLSCIGRDIERREIKLRRNDNNIWEKISDSIDNVSKDADTIVSVIEKYFAIYPNESVCAEPQELAKLLSDTSKEEVSCLTLLKRLRKNYDNLFKAGFSFESRRSNGRRLIEISKNEMNK